MSGPNLDLINSKTIEIIQDKFESSLRRKSRNRSPRKIKINSRAGGTEGAGKAIVPQDFGLPITEPNPDLIKNKTGSNDKVESSVRRKSRSGSLSKIETNNRAGETKVGLKLLTSEMSINEFSVRMVDANSIHLFFLS